MKNKVYSDINITYSFYSVVVKRFLDIFFSFLAILTLLPFLILFYFITLLFNGYPAIYKQARPGKNHLIFQIYKFRSMNNKKDEKGNLLSDEERITLWGKFIRKLSIDELPQLFNILKGDMSFVGPRPRLVKDMMFYNEDVFRFYIVRPGLTGATQCDGRNKNTWEMVFKKDISYMQNITFLNDLKIFFKTFISVFVSKGETHSNTEENKEETKDEEYYYADYIRRIGKITDEQYYFGITLSKKAILNKEQLLYHPELHDMSLFNEKLENNKLEK